MRVISKILMIALGIAFVTKVEAQTEVRFYTSMGNFDIVLTDSLTPITVDSFIARVAGKFYDGTIFHRVIDNFMIQGGDPLGTGYGDPGYTIPDEFHPTLKNVPKAFAMANAGPNTGGSQFFINLVTNSHLNNKHTVFGMVSTNFSVVQSIGHVPVNSNSKPLTNVVVDSIRITKFPNSVKNLTNKVFASVYPNPCKGEFHIDLPSVISTVEITNMAGTVVYSMEATGELKVDFKDKAKGLYVVRLSNAMGVSETKIVVQ